MRSDRFTSIAAVIALLATVQVAHAASEDGYVSTVTLTRTIYNNKPSSVVDRAPASDFQKSRDHEEHYSTINPQPITHHITEIYHATQAPSSSRPMPVQSASSVVIVSAMPTQVNNNNGEEVIVKTKTKKLKTKLKTKTNNKNSTAMQPVATQSAPMNANPIQTAPASVSQLEPPMASSFSLASSSSVVAAPSSSIMSDSSSLIMPSASDSAYWPIGTSLDGIPPAAAPPSVVSMPMPPSASGSPMPSGMVSGAPSSMAPPSSAPSAAPAPAPVSKQAPTIDSVNSPNKKINPPAASANPVSGAPLDKSVGPALFLAWLMAAVAAF